MAAAAAVARQCSAGDAAAGSAVLRSRGVGRAAAMLLRAAGASLRSPGCRLPRGSA